MLFTITLLNIFQIDLPEISNKINFEREEREKSMDMLFQDMNLEFNKLISAVNIK
jgi:hypothetical protein